jgi:hypothetical protein
MVTMAAEHAVDIELELRATGPNPIEDVFLGHGASIAEETNQGADRCVRHVLRRHNGERFGYDHRAFPGSVDTEPERFPWTRSTRPSDACVATRS